ncbi:MAG: carboxy terminal-processing peptidase, partial [Pseudomonadota bacterium]
MSRADRSSPFTTHRPGILAALLMAVWMAFTGLHAMAADDTTDSGEAEEREAFDEDGLPDTLVLEELYSRLDSEPVHGETAMELLRELESKHYADVTFDERFSRRVYDNYIEALDGSRLYFLQSDLDEFSRYEEELAGLLQSGNIEPAFEIYNRYVQRVMERLIWTIDHVESDLADLDFTVEEHLEIDRDDAEWATDRQALDELWRKRVKNSALSLKLTGMDMETVEERLSERYRNQLSQLTKTNSRDVFQSYLSTVAKTVDPHTGYFSPRDSENFNMGLRGSLQGIGAQLTIEGEFTKVAELIKGGPAEQAGELKAGDRIIAIGQGESGEMKDVIGLRLDDVVDQIRGEKGTTVRLNVIPAEATSEAAAREIAITRDTVELTEQFASSDIIDVEMDGQQYRVGVITLPSFYMDFQAAQRGDEDYRSSSRDVARLLDELQDENVEAVVMDLRYNGGGSLNEANELVGLFIEGGPTVQIRYSGLRNGFVRSYGDTDTGTAYNGPLAVLVNRASASASEIFAGAIQDYQRGIVLGGQTFGKGTVQEIIPMDYGQVKLTRSKFYRISGASTQHRGVMPDIEFPDRYQAIDSMGESNLDGALPWDTVRPVEYDTYYPLRRIMPELQERHQQRAARDP